MKVIDLTHPIMQGMPLYPGTEPVALKTVADYETDGFRETQLTFTSHTGTHMDAPRHVFGDKIGLDDMPAEQFVGTGLVIDCRSVEESGIIGMETVDKVRELADTADFLLFCTGWDRYWGEEKYFGDYPVISMEVCQYLLDSGKKGVGFDAIGIDAMADGDLPRHRKLLAERDIVIIENLTHLEEVGGKLFRFAALPLKYQEADGAPVRALAIVE